MNKLFDEFTKPDKETWKQQFLHDLKGKSHEFLEFRDPVEDIDFIAYYHKTDQSVTNDEPGNYPFQRGFNGPDNHTNNMALVRHSDEKAANDQALKYLMSGADSIWFNTPTDHVDMPKLLNDIQLEFIHCQFEVSNLKQFQEVRHHFINLARYDVSFNYDALKCIHQGEIELLADLVKDRQERVLLINGFALQQTGASAIEEIAYCLATGHESIVRLMDQGLTIDEAAACLHFHVGVGSDYLLQITKIKVLKGLWAKIIREYHPKHDCTYNITISAITGHLNKSLADPYSNLLRQTTEAMSAISAGVDTICVLPYDLYSEDGQGSLAGRMALNIPLILKEESYFDKVIDPAAGSYSLDHLYNEVGRKAWNLFRELEADGGIASESCLNNFIQKVEITRERRLQSFQNGEQTLIGVNKYPNPENIKMNWNIQGNYLGLNPLIIEVALNKVVNEG